MKLLLLCCSCIFFITSNGQALQETPPLSDKPFSNRLSQYRIVYPVGLNGDTFYNGALEYQLSNKLAVQIEKFYAKFGTVEQFNVSVSFRWDVTERLNIFAGLEQQYETNLATGTSQLMRVNLNFGVGYHLKEDVLLELGYHQQISKPKTDAFGRLIPKQNSFSLRAKW